MNQHLSIDTRDETVVTSSPSFTLQADKYANNRTPSNTAKLKPEWLKLTILSLSGIHVCPGDQNNQRRTRRPAQNFSITASCSFTGSCDPKDLRVVSSGLCTTSGLLVVESQPVVVPSGMTDGLIAVWDDSNQNLRHQGSLYSSDTVIFGKQRGAISACPEANPHLFVQLHDNIQSQKDNFHRLLDIEDCAHCDTQDSTIVSSLSCGPDLDDTDISSCPTAGTIKAAYSPSRTRRSVDDTIHCISEEMIEEERLSNNIDCAVVNTPFQAAAVPEILEMQIALHINQVPMNHYNQDENDLGCHRVRSSCEPSSEGGGAVAHLILFPDILNENDGKGELDGAGNGRILELPVRKRPVPLSGNHSSVSGLTSREANMSVSSSRNRSRKCQTANPDAHVDLEETAFIRVKLEYCTEGENQSLHRDEASTIVSTKKKDNDPDLPMSPIDLLKDGLNEINDQDDSLIGQVANISSYSHDFDASINLDDDDDGPHNPRPNMEGLMEDLNRLNEDRTTAPTVICGQSFEINGLLKSFKGMLGYCGDDVGMYQGLGGAASMDSTIYTSGSINI